MSGPSVDATNPRARGQTAVALVFGALVVFGILASQADDSADPEDVAADAPTTATAPPPTPTVTPTPTPPPLPRVSQARLASPEVISDWQAFLRAQGYKLRIDGTFNERTARLTARWQRTAGLRVTQRLDRRSYAAMLAFQEANPTPTPAPTATAVPTATPRPTPRPVTGNVLISCPDDDAGSWDWYDAGFYVSAGPQDVPFEYMAVDYGDGNRVPVIELGRRSREPDQAPLLGTGDLHRDRRTQVPQRTAGIGLMPVDVGASGAILGLRSELRPLRTHRLGCRLWRRIWQRTRIRLGHRPRHWLGHLRARQRRRRVGMRVATELPRPYRTWQHRILLRLGDLRSVDHPSTSSSSQAPQVRGRRRRPCSHNVGPAGRRE